MTDPMQKAVEAAHQRFIDAPMNEPMPATVRGMIEAALRVLSAEAVAWQSRHYDSVSGYWLGWGQERNEDDAKERVRRYEMIGIKAEYRSLFLAPQPAQILDGWRLVKEDEAEALRKDAERYCWLRQFYESVNFQPEQHDGMDLIFSVPQIRVSADCDATIDAAMLATAPAPGGEKDGRP